MNPTSFERNLELTSSSSPPLSLRLKLNHSLGYSLIRSPDAPHEPTKILVRNDAVPNVQSLPLPTEEDDKKRAEFADRLWALTEAA